MSTKIYTGFRLRNTSLEQALELVNEFRPVIAEKSKEMLADSLAKRLVHQVDLIARNHAAGNMVPVEETTCDEVWDAMMSDLDEALRGGGFLIDSSSFQINLFALGDDVLGITHSAQDQWEDIWAKLPQVEDYHFQDQSDRPSHLTEAEWEQREADWNTVYGDKWWDANMYGLVATVHPERGPKPSIEDVFAKIPDMATRARAAARDKVRFKVMKEAEQKSGGKKSWSFVLGPANDYLKTEAGQARVQQETERLMEILPELTLENLRDGVEFAGPGSSSKHLPYS